MFKTSNKGGGLVVTSSFLIGVEKAAELVGDGIPNTADAGSKLLLVAVLEAGALYHSAKETSKFCL